MARLTEKDLDLFRAGSWKAYLMECDGRLWANRTLHDKDSVQILLQPDDGGSVDYEVFRLEYCHYYGDISFVKDFAALPDALAEADIWRDEVKVPALGTHEENMAKAEALARRFGFSVNL